MSVERKLSWSRIRISILVAALVLGASMAASNWLTQDVELKQFSPKYSLSQVSTEGLAPASAKYQNDIYDRASRATTLGFLLHGASQRKKITDVTAEDIEKAGLPLSRESELKIARQRLKDYASYASSYGTYWPPVAKRSAIFFLAPAAVVWLLFWIILGPLKKYMRWINPPAAK